MKTKITILFLLVAGISFQALSQITILSGPKQASYHRFVDDIAGVLNTDTETMVVNKETSGAAYNFNQLADPKSPYKVALMQSDYLYFMQARDMMNNSDQTKPLKVLLPLANEEIHVVTKKSFNINKLQDLDSMTVAIGTKDQGTYATANLIKDRSQVYWKSRNVHFVDALKELALDRVHAFMIVGSAPIEKLDINPQVLRDEPVIVELNDFNGWAKNYIADTIYAKDYPWLDHDTPTFSVRTVLIVNEDKLTDKDREQLKKIENGILNKYDLLKAQGHPKWKEVDFGAWGDSDWPMLK
jgi:TRAP transporter TAXI family solute receptor